MHASMTTTAFSSRPFTTDEDDAKKAARKATAKEYGFDGHDESDHSDDEIRVATGAPGASTDAAAAGGAGGSSAPADPATAAAAAAAAAVAAAMTKQREMAAQAAANASAAGSAYAAAGIPGPAPPMSATQAHAGFAPPVYAQAPAGVSTGSTPVNPAILIAQQVAARLAAGAPAAGGHLQPHVAPMAPSIVTGPGGGAVNPMLAAALSNIPGVQLAGASVSVLIALPLTRLHAATQCSNLHYLTCVKFGLLATNQPTVHKLCALFS